MICTDLRADSEKPPAQRPGTGLVHKRFPVPTPEIRPVPMLAGQTRAIGSSGAKPALICEAIGTSARIFETEVWPKKAILSLLCQEGTE